MQQLTWELVFSLIHYIQIPENAHLSKSVTTGKEGGVVGRARAAVAPLVIFGARPHKRLRYSNRAVGYYNEEHRVV